MKKNLLIIAMLLAFFPSVKAQYNLFDPADVDADGWLWFNSQAKIDKYVGIGKPIELQDASFDPYLPSTASAEVKGAGTDGILESATAITGALLLSPSSGAAKYDGGGIVMYLPSCSALSMSLSCTATMYPQLKGGVGKVELPDMISIKAYTAFTKLSSMGQKKWENIQSLTNATGLTLNSTSAVSAQIINGTKSILYVHGIKVYTTAPTSINNTTVNKFSPRYFNKTLSLNQVANVKVYTIGGKLVAEETNSAISLSKLDKGVYMARIKNNEGEGCTKILVY